MARSITRAEIEERLERVSAAFRPAAPVDEQRFFSGRVEQLRRSLEAVREPGRHAVLYGERGVGKTSLATIIGLMVRASRQAQIVVQVTCDSNDTLASIWHKAARKISITKKRRPIGFDAVDEKVQQQLTDLVASGSDVGPGEIEEILQRLPSSLFVIDEFDRIAKQDTRRLVADTLKTLSDNTAPSTWLLVGVGKTVAELIEEHQSIERCLAQIPLPRMQRDELEGILDKGFAHIGIEAESAVIEKIVSLSQGFPHYTHLIGKHTARTAVLDGRDTVTYDDFREALELSIDQVQESIRDAYQKATISTKPTLFADVLLACAMLEGDEHGTFRATDVEAPLHKLGHRHSVNAFSYHLGQLCNPARGPILEKLGTPKRHRYRFVNPLMKPYILMKAYAEGRISNGIV